ncbi:helix-turn-helix domain-containing protein [Yersinia aleksiciae]|uniref:helix-turn-helix domain-containing protein n=1 Tax=Yersinia aleksiciae TaxID=263819 RepID=UPI00119E9AD3|nr:helix-turn-helix transcriptional regulator [Yersinia aleksiciae]
MKSNRQIQREDWHTADILSALKKRGKTLSGVSRAAGLSSATLTNALKRPWPKGEWLIADALEIHPAEIWPSRYYDGDGRLIDRKKRIRGKPSE